MRSQRKVDSRDEYRIRIYFKTMNGYILIFKSIYKGFPYVTSKESGRPPSATRLSLGSQRSQPSTVVKGLLLVTRDSYGVFTFYVFPKVFTEQRRNWIEHSSLHEFRMCLPQSYVRKMWIYWLHPEVRTQGKCLNMELTTHISMTKPYPTCVAHGCADLLNLHCRMRLNSFNASFCLNWALGFAVCLFPFQVD